MWGIIATWEMAFDGVKVAADILEKNGNVMDAVERCVNNVEENEDYASVGYGGLPNENCEVELDAAFMDGNTLSIGAVASVKNILNPSSVARSLMKGPFNNFLVGKGAEDYAYENGIKVQDMLTDKSIAKWTEHRDNIMKTNLNPYVGHDTICAIGVDSEINMATCTSTSGLFYKKAGRVGDSPIPGSGYYVDSEIGGACATGLGEDIMKGCISFEIVSLMSKGFSPQKACEKATKELNDKLIKKRLKAGDISVIAMNNEGEFGASTNIEEFPFVVATRNIKPKVFIAKYDGEKTSIIEG